MQRQQCQDKSNINQSTDESFMINDLFSFFVPLEIVGPVKTWMEASFCVMSACFSLCRQASVF